LTAPGRGDRVRRGQRQNHHDDTTSAVQGTHVCSFSCWGSVGAVRGIDSACRPLVYCAGCLWRVDLPCASC